jgi:hypothetical protein
MKRQAGPVYNRAKRSLAARRCTAWLGLLAMCLLVLMPLASRSLAMVHGMTMPMAMSMAGAAAPASARSMDDLCTAGRDDEARPADHRGRDGSRGDLLAACGYCDFLADHAVMPGVAPAALVLASILVFIVPPVPGSRIAAFGAFPSGRPRAPPLLPRPAP